VCVAASRFPAATITYLDPRPHAFACNCLIRLRFHHSKQFWQCKNSHAERFPSASAPT
jgi:hypothetical protein